MLQPPRRRNSGPWAVLAIFIFGGIFLAGLYWTAHRRLPDSYRKATVGAPNRPLRIAAEHLNWDSSRMDPLIVRLRAAQCDFVFLQALSRRDAQRIGAELDMRSGGAVQMFYSPNNDADPSAPAAAILSRHPLYQGRSLPKAGARDFGIFAEAIIDGRRFALVCVDMETNPRNEFPESQQVQAIQSAWQKAGQPPIIIAGAMRNWQPDRSFPLKDWTIGQFPATAGPAQTTLFSPHWKLGQSDGHVLLLHPKSTADH